jgi:hypothetical protein
MTTPGFGEISERLRRRRSGAADRAAPKAAGPVSSERRRSDYHQRPRSPRLSEGLAWDGSTYDASVLNRDTRRDLASLKIHATGLPQPSPVIRALCESVSW